jgi:beta-lactamase class A
METAGMVPFLIVIGMTVLGAPPDGARAEVEASAKTSLAAVPGRSAFVFTELSDNGVQPLFGIDADREFAVGSSFKLFILGRLIDEVNAGKRRLSDTMRLEGRLVGPPHSEMAAWPTGMPVTLSTLALKMIWISDNTATDHLHALLGREEIERQMQAMGHSHAAVNRPLLSTREMTMLRDRKRGMPGRGFRQLDEAARRAYLAKEFAGAPDYGELDFDTAAFDVAEWYATPLDMARALAWIQRHTDGNRPASDLRKVLTVDSKLKLDAALWPYVGFKGGSEDQLLAGNWLLRHRSGRWHTFHVFFNNPDGPLKPEQALPAIEQVLKSIEASLGE